VRGRPAFILAKLIRHLHPILRKSAELSDWQVISRGRGAGQVEVVSALKSIQNKTFPRPTVVITDTVAGDENIPQGVTAIVTPDATDVVSHAAIRARNSGVLLATCYNPETVERLKSLTGKLINLQVNSAGEVIFEEGSGEKAEAAPSAVTRVPKPSFRPRFTAYAVPAGDFNEKIVGGKSNNLKRLRDKVPDWIHLLNSVALPFGVFEEVLAEKDNQEVAGVYHELAGRVDREEVRACLA
jgi:alpha-glucan,water dikinase